MNRSDSTWATARSTSEVSFAVREISSPVRLREKYCIESVWMRSNMAIRRSITTRFPTHSMR